eukprot:TRINITY_DN67807_c3_g7_i1.p1 TRINITY_DN67807_c3_g7~~TRINITY_DN67807_c3_g7_i1.p1  ORF type:complete len:741 (-),score=353.69 TRINITY_DN67807_c3_g7_i1:461-2512(-)
MEAAAVAEEADRSVVLERRLGGVDVEAGVGVGVRRQLELDDIEKIAEDVFDEILADSVDRCHAAKKLRREELLALPVDADQFFLDRPRNHKYVALYMRVCAAHVQRLQAESGAASTALQLPSGNAEQQDEVVVVDAAKVAIDTIVTQARENVEHLASQIAAMNLEYLEEYAPHLLADTTATQQSSVDIEEHERVKQEPRLEDAVVESEASNDNDNADDENVTDSGLVFVPSRAPEQSQQNESQLMPFYVNPGVYHGLMTLYSHTGRVKDALEVVLRMRQEGVPRDVYTYSSLVDACARNGDMKLAQQVVDHYMFSDNVQPNEVTYTSLINGYLKAGQVDECWNSFHAMRRQGIQPDQVVYHQMLRVCGQRGEAERALNVLQEMRQSNTNVDTVTFNSLLYALARRAGDDMYQYTFSVYREMLANGHVPTSYTFNTLLYATSQVGDIDNAHMLLQHMDTHRVRKDRYTFHSFLSTLAHSQRIRRYRSSVAGDDTIVFLTQKRRIEIAHETLDEMVRLNKREQAKRKPQRMAIKTDTLNHVLSVYAHAGATKAAEKQLVELFDKRFPALTPDRHTYTILIGMYHKTKKLDKAVATLRQAEQAGIKPSKRMYQVILHICKKLQAYEQGAELLEEMESKYAYKPSERDIANGTGPIPRYEKQAYKDKMRAMKQKTSRSWRRLGVRPF